MANIKQGIQLSWCFTSGTSSLSKQCILPVWTL